MGGNLSGLTNDFAETTFLFSKEWRKVERESEAFPPNTRAMARFPDISTVSQVLPGVMKSRAHDAKPVSPFTNFSKKDFFPTPKIRDVESQPENAWMKSSSEHNLSPRRHFTLLMLKTRIWFLDLLSERKYSVLLSGSK